MDLKSAVDAKVDIGPGDDCDKQETTANGPFAKVERSPADSGFDDSEEQASSKRRIPKENRRCTVCGDKALGFNFDAVSCESCKAFFRRNANKVKHPRCMFNSSCKIDSNTRRFCSACRLSKCFLVGMKKEMILGDEEKQKRTQKVLQNRAKKSGRPNEILSTITDGESDSISHSKYGTTEDLSAQMHTCTDTQSSTNSFMSMEGIDESPPFCASPVATESVSRVLTSSEISRINYLEDTYACTFGMVPDDCTSKPADHTLEAFVNHLGGLIKLLIRFAKKLKNFTSLPDTAQISLLKGSFLDCLLWRSVLYFNKESNGWFNPRCGEETPLNVLDVLDPASKDEYVSLCSGIQQLINGHTTIIPLVQCVLLFTPEFSSVGYHTLAASVQDYYITLLKHYLESKYDWQIAFDLFANILSYISRVKRYSAKHRTRLADCDASQVEPLLQEVFNISSSV